MAAKVGWRALPNSWEGGPAGHGVPVLFEHREETLVPRLAFDGEIGLFRLHNKALNGDRVMAAFEAIAAALLAGDYNNDGLVGAGDLDLVLANWGDDASVTGVPAGWINMQPTGLIGAAQLDEVLANWGATAAASVPEPAAALPLFFWLLAILRRQKCS